MKLNVKWFSIASLIMGTIPLLALFIWCAINGFGAQLVGLFESIHPSGGFSIIENIDKELSTRIIGILINTLYAAIDSFILGFGFSSLYNLFISKYD